MERDRERYVRVRDSMQKVLVIAERESSESSLRVQSAKCRVQS